MRRSQRINIFLVVFIVMLGFGLIMPLLPYFAAEYGGNDLVVGLLVASYAAAQFVGAPVLGRLSDRIGRRPVLAVSLAGTALGFVLLGLADPIGRGLASLLAPGGDSALQNSAVLGVMFVSRIVTGLAGGSITAAQAYMADITDAEHRTIGQGIIMSAFGLGFILGPVIGGVLSRSGYALPAFVAAGLSALNLLTIFFLLPESLTEERKAQLSKREGQPLISFTAIVLKMGRTPLGSLLKVRLFSSLAASLFMSMFALWARGQLGLSVASTSYLMAYLGLLSIIVQVVFIGPLTKRFTNPLLVSVAVTIMVAGLLLWAFSPNVPVLLVALLPVAFAMGILNTCVNAAITQAVPPEDMGDALGTASALESLSRVLAPPLGGWLLGVLGMWAPGVAGAIVMGGLSVFVWRGYSALEGRAPVAPAPAA